MAAVSFGAEHTRQGTRFRVWAPRAQRVDLVLEGLAQDSPQPAEIPMQPSGEGFYEAFAPQVGPGSRYRYRLDGGPPFPDPASRHQPEGVHGPSAVVAPERFPWTDQDWSPPPLEQLVFYELHAGTFSEPGTFAAVTEKLAHLASLGVNAIELMPVADFPGRWNWGYDPAAFWAPSRAYGHPDDLRQLVDRAHSLGLAVFLDVIYNHFGPDGAYVVGYGPFLTERHQTPWGRAVNLDDEGSAQTREFFIANALHWLAEYHLDGLRLDAVFALVDDSPEHFLAELAERVGALPGPRRYLVAEDNRNLDRIVRAQASGGFGLDSQWSDDFHHLMRRYLAGDHHGYFADFPASCAAIAEAINKGWLFQGQRSEFCPIARGTPTDGLGPERFVFCLQNHDQVGNRPAGDRLHHSVDLDAYRAASALLLFLPELPLLFMGQEWACSTPFIYFTDHEPELGRAVQQGRRREFSSFPGFAGELPDPQAPESFQRSKLRWEEREQPPHRGVLQLYRDLLGRRTRLRGELRAESPSEGVLFVARGKHRLAIALRSPTTLSLPRAYTIVWHSHEERYTETPRPPERRGNELHFAAPAAVLMEQQETE